MLVEHFIASIGTPAKAPNTSVTKDAGIFVHELQPLAGQRSLFKKSATKEQCLAVSESHIFAAQQEKAVINVYNREKGNQEATIPFNERIACIVLACENSVLVLGTESGRILLWEICTGRLVSTPQSHLQSVTSLTIDPTSNFLLSGSGDSNIHVWSIPALLSFTKTDSSAQVDPRAPIHTLSNHRSAITILVCGHGHGPANIAISASSDQTAVVWDYRKGTALRTYLLGGIPRALVLDSIDRGFYVTYDDGSVQLIDLYASTGSTNSLYDDTHAQTAIQPGKENLWIVEGQELGSGMSLGLNWDGSRLLSGHRSGKIISWDTGKGRFITVLNALPGPVTNLAMLSPTGFPNRQPRPFKVHTVMKPRISTDDTSPGNGSMIPGNYTFNAQLTSQLPPIQFSATDAPMSGLSDSQTSLPKSAFETALTHPYFPADMLNAGLAELSAWREAPTNAHSSMLASSGQTHEESDFLALNNSSGAKKRGKQPPKMTTEQENEFLKKQVASLQRLQKASFQQLKEKRKEIEVLVEEQRRRDGLEARKKIGGDEDGEGEAEDEDKEMEDAESSEGDDSEEESGEEAEGSDMSSDRG